MGFSGLLLLITVWQFWMIPKGFFPTEDTGQIFVFTEAGQDISFEAMRQHQLALNSIVLHNPNVANFMSSIGAGGPNATLNTGRMFMRLKPINERQWVPSPAITWLADKFSGVTFLASGVRSLARTLVTTLLRTRSSRNSAKAGSGPGIRAFMQVPPPIRIGGMLTKSQYQFTLQSPDTDALYSNAAAIETKMRQLSGLQDVTSDLQIKNPQAMIQIDRDKARPWGLPRPKSKTHSTPRMASGRSPLSTPRTTNTG